MFLKKSKIKFILLFVLFVLGFLIRICGLDWDNGQHLHPDERFLTMVTSDIKLPTNIFQYFDTKNSPLNPYNYQNYRFFVYGTFPIFLIKFISSYFGIDSYQSVYLFGRIFSALFDSLNIILLYFLSVRIIKNKKYHFVASFTYAFTVLPIQLSHFYTVDTFLNTFLLATFLLLILWCQFQKSQFLYLSAIIFGLAISTKISAVLFLPVVLLFCLYYYFTINRSLKLVSSVLISGIIVFLVFRTFQPYAFQGLFIPNPDFVSSIRQLNEILNNRSAFYPPEVQYLSKTPLVYPLSTIVFWSLGLPMSLLLFASLLYLIIRFRQLSFYILVLAFWVIFIIVEQGLQFTNPARYFLPAFPLISLISAFFLSRFGQFKKIIFIFLFFHCLYAFAYINIYLRPHSRIQASTWIYKNVPLGSGITNEYWDDPLPLNIGNSSIASFNNIMLPLYDQDIIEKWKSINQILVTRDYILMSSNRLWGSIPPVSDRYPLTSKYYQSLFDEQLAFQKLISFHSYPGFYLPFLHQCYYLGPSNYPFKVNKNTWFSIDPYCNYPGIYFRDDTAEESFTVYDHPQVIIYKKK